MHDLPNASVLVSVLDVGVEVGALGRCSHEPLVRFRRNVAVLVDATSVELDLKNHGLRVMADAAEV